MKEALLCKGLYEVIIQREVSKQANILYSKLQKIFKERRFNFRTVETKPDYELSEKISKETEFLIGHSCGAGKIMEGLKSAKNVKGIILLDPSEMYVDVWNSITKPKLLFGSGWCQDYSEFENRVNLSNDDHYFNNSLPTIDDRINEFLDANK